MIRIWVDYNAWGGDKKGYFVMLDKRGTADSMKSQNIEFKKGLEALFYSDDDADEHGKPRYVGGLGYMDISEESGKWVAYIDKTKIVHATTLSELETNVAGRED